ncbi:MAG: hypothetical protein R3336_03185, partial [Phycisphaeraceae bacterium]|nr:hypothetical protein [Phycisphaeraceae bacterium]
MAVENETIQAMDPLADRIPAERARAAGRLTDGYEVTFISAAYWRNGAGWALPTRRLDDCMILMPTAGRVEA